MKIIVPMAGMGKRMRPHTLLVPKPLIPVAGKTIVHRLVEDIAGVCNEDGNIVGMMPHPERAVESEINPQDNKPSSLIFESLLKKVGVEN